MTHSSTSRSITTCQVCNGTKLKSLFFFGYMPLVNELPAISAVSKEQTVYPLELMRCDACTLVQLGLVVNENVLFPADYPYRSGQTRIIRETFADLYSESTAMLNLKQGDFIFDLGSNDGTLLKSFKEAGFKVLGIDPCAAAETANAQGIKTISTYFNPGLAKEIRSEFGAAKVITATSVLAHVQDIHSVMTGVSGLLADDGVLIAESHSLVDLMNPLQYDTIYHEHPRYYSLKSYSHLLKMHGLEIFHVKQVPTHGGSLRTYAAPLGTRSVQASVQEFLNREKTAGLDDGSFFKDFARQVVTSKLELLSLFHTIKKEKARIYGVGAPSRASTLINYMRIDDGILDCTLEMNTSSKMNRYLPGTRIPVLDEEKLFTDQPEYALLLSWHIADELAVKLRQRGFRGKFITPLPHPRVLDF